MKKVIALAGTAVVLLATPKPGLELIRERLKEAEQLVRGNRK